MQPRLPTRVATRTVPGVSTNELMTRACCFLGRFERPGGRRLPPTASLRFAFASSSTWNTLATHLVTALAFCTATRASPSAISTKITRKRTCDARATARATKRANMRQLLFDAVRSTRKRKLAIDVTRHRYACDRYTRSNGKRRGTVQLQFTAQHDPAADY